jgi:hypothetical protein
MKGGITSGIVYPTAACELSKVYNFKNIGGTSAGAIAAAVTAAAQYRFNQGDAEGFVELGKLPEWLGATANGAKFSNLFTLFQPQPETRPIYKLVVAFLSGGRMKMPRVAFTALRNFPVGTLIGAVPGAIFVVLLYLFSGGLPLYFGLFPAILIVILGAAAGMAFSIWRKASSCLPGNFYGLCSGNAVENSTPRTDLLAV